MVRYVGGPEIVVRARGDFGRLDRDLRRTQGNVTGLGKAGRRAFAALGAGYAVAELSRAALAVGKVGAEYVGSLNQIQALTDATDRQMQKASVTLEGQARDYVKYGQTTGDAAAGMVELTKSGLSLDKSLKAVRGTMLLAKAGELEVAQASELVANTLNTFDLRAGSAAKIANSLANAANISSADVSDLAESFKYAAPLAAKAGLSVEGTSAILAELSNSGIKASQAGTSLRGVLLALQAPSTGGAQWLDDLGVSVYDSRGKMRDFGDVIEDLRGGLSKVSDEERNFALKTIFGRNAITGAQVVLKGGKKTLDQYTKGVERAGAAEDLAASQSKGLAGTLDSVRARAVSAAQRLYRIYSPQLDRGLQKIIDGGDQIVAAYKLDGLDGAIRKLDELTGAQGRLTPVLDAGRDVADGLVRVIAALAPAFGEAAAELPPFLSPLKLLGDVAQVVASAVEAIPEPIRKLGAEAAIAALILPRLQSAVTAVSSTTTTGIAKIKQYGAELTYAETRAVRLGNAARGAAGIGGLLLLQASANTSNDALKILGSTAGGAFTGFAAGGPIGGLIGAGVGAITGLVSATDDASESMQGAKVKAEDYASSLDQITGAATQATRALVLQDLKQQGALQYAGELGLSTRDLVSAVLGREAATKRVTSAIQKQITYDELFAQTSDQLVGKTYQGVSAGKKLADALGLTTAQLRQAIKSTREDALATQNLGKVFKGLPKKAITQIRADGVPTTRKQVRDLIRDFKLTPKQIRTLVQATGIKPARKGLQDVRKDAENVGKAKPNLSGWQRFLTAGLRGGQKTTKQVTGDIGDLLRLGNNKTKAQLSAFAPSITSGLGPAKSAASEGGRQVGANLRQGVINGFAGTRDYLSSQAAAAVRAAIASAKAAGKVRSPSRETHYIGRMLGQGLVDGLARKKPGAKKGGKDLVRSLLSGVDAGLQGVEKSLDRVTKLIEKRVNLKDSKKEAARERAILKHLNGQFDALKKNGKQQDANNRKLDAAVQKLKDARQAYKQYAASIKQAAIDFGSVVGLGQLEDGTVSTSGLLSDLQQRLVETRRYAALVKQLRSAGLNRTSLQQLIDAGVSGGLATAEAIAAGGSSAIGEINDVTKEIAKAGGGLGTAMAKEFKQAGIDAAAGLVRGLRQREKQLDKVADRLADRLVKAVKKALGIKSPSRVFRDLGGLTLDGLAEGLDQVYARRLGEGIGSSVATGYARGFTRPKLDAGVATAGGGTQVVEMRLSAEQIVALRQGREVVGQVDVANRAGVRTLAVSRK